jgi:hypothetical protein
MKVEPLSGSPAARKRMQTWLERRLGYAPGALDEHQPVGELPDHPLFRLLRKDPAP